MKIIRLTFTLACVFMICVGLDGQFVEINSEMTGIAYGESNWGDLDNDGDYDIIVTGKHHNGSFVDTTVVYMNVNNMAFNIVNSTIHKSQYPSISFGDYDNDGDLDLLQTGATNGFPWIKIYNNDRNLNLSLLDLSLRQVWEGSAMWGDYDNDGDLDALICGCSSFGVSTLIYKNNGDNSFTYSNIYLVGVYGGNAVFGDYDNDGDLDVLITGAQGDYPNYNPITKIYRNEGNDIFTDLTLNLVNVYNSQAKFGDYDNDGDLDFVIMGNTGSERITKIYQNEGNNSFIETDIMLPGLDHGSVDWGDFDNDGDLDLLVCGGQGYPIKMTRVYRNDGNNLFTDINAGLPGVMGYAKWGDYDNDGDLDILLNGSSANSYVTKIFRNDTQQSNQIPGTPSNLHVELQAEYIVFSWDQSIDSETPSSGLSYTLRVGTSPGGCEVSSPMAMHSTGYRLKPERGYVNSSCFWRIKRDSFIANTTYYWSVQAIDTALAGSYFATEQMFLNDVHIQDELISEDNSISCFPNPFNSLLYIKFKQLDNEILTVTIYNMRGQVVWSHKSTTGPTTTKTTILEWNSYNKNGNRLSEGLYLIRVKSGKSVISKKVLYIKG